MIMEKSWKNHGIVFLNFYGNPEYLFIYRQSPPQRELYMDRERDRERDYYQDYQRASYRSVNMVLYRFRSTKMLTINLSPGHVVQSVTCLATDTCLTADLGPGPILLWNFYGHSPPFR